MQSHHGPELVAELLQEFAKNSPEVSLHFARSCYPTATPTGSLAVKTANAKALSGKRLMTVNNVSCEQSGAAQGRYDNSSGTFLDFRPDDHPGQVRIAVFPS
jgi:hypothetical protein